MILHLLGLQIALFTHRRAELVLRGAWTNFLYFVPAKGLEFPPFML
jgi:hypothetical protein